METSMRRLAIAAAAAMALCGGAQAQSTTQDLKDALDQAMKTIQDLQARVKALEEQRAKVPQAAAGAAAAAAAAPPPAPGGGAGLERRGGRAQCRPGTSRDLRPGDGRRDLRRQEDEPAMGRHVAAIADSDRLPRQPRLRTGRSVHVQHPPVEPGRARLHSHHLRHDQDRPRVRPVRHRRHHQHPLVARVGRDGHVRRRTDRLELHGHQRVPQHDRLLGAARHGVRAQPAVPHHAVQAARP